MNQASWLCIILAATAVSLTRHVIMRCAHISLAFVVALVAVVVAASDWGDAPAPYPTLSQDSGASHVYVRGGARLGNFCDIEADGQPDPLARGDDDGVPYDTVLSDEDGVDVGTWTFAGRTKTFVIGAC